MSGDPSLSGEPILTCHMTRHRCVSIRSPALSGTNSPTEGTVLNVVIVFRRCEVYWPCTDFYILLVSLADEHSTPRFWSLTCIWTCIPVEIAGRGAPYKFI